MVKYSLVANNLVTNETRILVIKNYLVDIDKFVYNGFNGESDLKVCYQMSEEEDLKIKYTYNGVTKYLSPIFKCIDNHDFGSIINNTEGSKINKELSFYINYINEFLGSFNIDELDYLYDRGNIDIKLYNDLLSYIGIGRFNYNDKREIYSEIKSILRRYNNFRKLYLSLYNHRHGIKPKVRCFETEKKKINSTEDELLNNLYNYGDLDEVWGSYDLGDLNDIEGVEQLNIDGIGPKKSI